ncbi:MAG: hypothetical protein LBV08_03700 [Clostridiales bacterium]|jgi:cell division protein FtsX|nr:hypothetical protein [Clostridiales bacterium]
MFKKELTELLIRGCIAAIVIGLVFLNSGSGELANFLGGAVIGFLYGVGIKYAWRNVLSTFKISVSKVFDNFPIGFACTIPLLVLATLIGWLPGVFAAIITLIECRNADKKGIAEVDDF